MQKAWWVTDLYDDANGGLIVFAPTPGKAKKEALKDYGDEYLSLRAKRIPKADVWAEKGQVPDSWALQNDIYGYIECYGDRCFTLLYGDENTYYYQDKAYCLQCLVNNFMDGIYPAGTYSIWYRNLDFRMEDSVYCDEPIFINGEEI